MNADQHWRAVFGCSAFAAAIAVIGFVLSKYVPQAKEQIALVVLGNVLSWPGMVLAFYFGSSSGSKDKSARLAEAADSALLLKAQQGDQS